MKAKLWTALSALVVVSLTGCSAWSGIAGMSISPQVMASEKPRVSASVDEAALQELVAGNTEFALNLYQAIRDQDGNLFYSPFSISLALAMAYAGAEGETAQQMADTLGFTLDDASLHAAFNALDQYLASLDDGTKGRDEGGFRLKIANAIWGQKDYAFLPAFLDGLAENYGAGLRLLDFKQAAEESRKIINDWVAEQTEDKIKDLLPPNSLDAMTRMVLTNAIYFNAAWAFPFEASATQDGGFYLLDGTEINVPTMRETESLRYAKGDGYQAVELPYKDGKMSMVILLPDQGKLQEFEDSLYPGKLADILGHLTNAHVNLSLPKFEYKAELQLADTLSAMGMKTAFAPNDADFSGMDGSRLVYISDVFHKAYVSVNEAGTEAAAATAVVMRAAGMPLETIQFRVDQPFVFLIRDNTNGSILFLGRVMDPTQS